MSLSVSQIQFPKELTPCVNITQNQQQREKSMADLLVQKTTRDQFMSWAEQHQAFVASSPMMSQIVSKIAEYKDERVAQTKSIAGPIFRGEEEQVQVCRQIETGALLDKITPGSAALIAEYYKIGALPFERVKGMLQSLELYADFNTQMTGLKACVPLLKEMDPDRLVELLSLWFKKNLTGLMHNEQIFAKMLFFLEQLNPAQLYKFLSTRDENGHIVLDAYTARFAIPLLEKLPPAERLELLTLQDEEGQSPALSVFFEPKSVSLLQDLDFEQTKHLLAAIPFPLNEKVWKELLPTLKKFSFEQLKGFLKNVRMNTQFFITAETLLGGFKAERLRQIFAIQDRYGQTPMHDAATVTAILPLLERQRPEDLIGHFSIQNREGHIPLQDLEVLKKLLPFLQRQPADLRVQLFSIQDAEGNTLFHSDHPSPYFPEEELFALLNSKISGAQIFQFLTIENKQGQRVLDRPEFLSFLISSLRKAGAEAQLASLMDKFGPDLISKILSFKEHEWDPSYLQEIADKNPINLEPYLPVLARCSSEQLFQLTSMRNGEGQTVLHTPHAESFDLFLSLLEKKCSPAQLAKLLSICDKSGNTPLDNETMRQKLIHWLPKVKGKL